MNTLKEKNLDSQLTDRAVDSLLNYISKQQKNAEQHDLFANQPDFIWLMISTHRILDKIIKPIAIPLKHPLYDTSTELCLITKDPQKVFKEWVKSKDMKNIKKVIGITKFRKKYSSFEDKRILCDSYDLFLADDRILSYLPKLLGKYFFEKKKQPIPVKISKETTFCKEILKSCHSTYLHFSSGTYFAIKIGKSDMTSRQIVENIEISVPKIIEKIPRKWRNIQSLSIKTNSSTSLPIFNSLPEISKLVINKTIDDDEKEKVKVKKKVKGDRKKQ